MHVLFKTAESLKGQSTVCAILLFRRRPFFRGNLITAGLSTSFGPMFRGFDFVRTFIKTWIKISTQKWNTITRKWASTTYTKKALFEKSGNNNNHNIKILDSPERFDTCVRDKTCGPRDKHATITRRRHQRQKINQSECEACAVSLRSRVIASPYQGRLPRGCCLFR